MIIIQLILFCALFTLMVKIAVGNNALNGLYFYPKPVQDRAFEIGLTDRETVARKRKRFMIPFKCCLGSSCASIGESRFLGMKRAFPSLRRCSTNHHDKLEIYRRQQSADSKNLQIPSNGILSI